MSLSRPPNGPPEDTGWGLVGLVVAVVGILVGGADSSRVFRMFVCILFFVGAADCLLMRKLLSALGWALFGVGFLLGYSLLGRWGMLVGLGIAFLIITPLINRYEY